MRKAWRREAMFWTRMEERRSAIVTVKKKVPPRNEASPIVHHGRSLPRITLRSIRATRAASFPQQLQPRVGEDLRLLLREVVAGARDQRPPIGTAEEFRMRLG